MSTFGVFQIGATGLNAASVGLNVISHNISNAATPGYSRRVLSQVVWTQGSNGGLLIGGGTKIDGITRVNDNLLGVRLIDQAGQSGAADAFATYMGQIEVWFNEAEREGVAQRLESFWDSLTALTENPADSALRQDVIYKAHELASDIRQTAEGLQSVIVDLDQQIAESVTDLNNKLRQVADYNAAIQSAQESGGLGLGDLMDQRDQILTELAEDVGVTANIDTEGLATVFLDGHALVTGAQAREVSAIARADGTTGLMVSMGSGTIDLTNGIGGKLGGMNEARTQALDYLEALNTFAETLADALNTQHNAGFDADGNTGLDMFSYTSGSAALDIAINPSLLDDPRLLAVAGSGSAAEGDGDNLSDLIALESVGLFPTGETATDYINALFARVGADTNTANTNATQQAAVLSDLQALRDAISSVNLDEEATQLLEYQAIYQAASRVIAAADEMIQTLLQTV